MKQVISALSFFNSWEFQPGKASAQWINGGMQFVRWHTQLNPQNKIRGANINIHEQCPPIVSLGKGWIHFNKTRHYTLKEYLGRAANGIYFPGQSISPVQPSIQCLPCIIPQHRTRSSMHPSSLLSQILECKSCQLYKLPKHFQVILQSDSSLEFKVSASHIRHPSMR